MKQMIRWILVSLVAGAVGSLVTVGHSPGTDATGYNRNGQAWVDVTKDNMGQFKF